MRTLAGDAVDTTSQALGRVLPVTLVHAAYTNIRQVLDALGIARVQGVLLDLGFSSDQLQWEDRGISLAFDGPLDMRFDLGTWPNSR
jgi:16S rRNA (cytosine1402-N4)-methyltransferase